METAKEQRRISFMHYLLGLYNGVVVLLLAGFMSLTQQKIVNGMGARSFLETLPIVPLPPAQGFALPLGAFCLLLVLGWFYRQDQVGTKIRYLLLAAETGRDRAKIRLIIFQVEDCSVSDKGLISVPYSAFISFSSFQ